MNLKPVLSLTIIVICLFFPSYPVLAKKKLPPRPIASQLAKPYGAWVKPKLRSDRHALLLMLGGMHYADSLDYTLTYQAGPVPQGIRSYHTPEHGSTQKELLFGTCSGQDCIYHGDISDMILEVTIKLKDGRTLIQRYQINP